MVDNVLKFKPVVRVLFFLDDGSAKFVFQCVDYDIAAKGDSIEDALNSFIFVVRGMENAARHFSLNSDNMLKNSSDEYLERWNKARDEDRYSRRLTMALSSLFRVEWKVREELVTITMWCH